MLDISVETSRESLNNSAMYSFIFDDILWVEVSSLP